MKRSSALVAVCLLAAAAAGGGVGVWTTSGPADFQSNSFVVADSAIAGTLYVATGTGMAKSTDNGATWSATGSIADQPAYPLAASNGTVYASVFRCDHPFSPPSPCSNTVYESSDGGERWQELFQQGFVGGLQFRIVVDPVTPSTLYRISTSIDLHHFAGSGLDRSVDGGQSWTQLGYGDVITAFLIDPGNTATLYLARVPAGQTPIPPPPPELLKSTDAGATWKLLTSELAVSALVLDPLTPTTLYAAAAGGVFRSTDGGDSFAPISSVPAGDARLWAMVIDPKHPSHLYGQTSLQGVFASSDAGVTWTALNEGLSGPALWVHSIVIDTIGKFLHATTGAPGVWDYQIVPDPGVLTLNAGHSFSVTLTATDQRTGRTGTGVATQVNDLWGYFSLPSITGNPNNPEVFVKLLDGTAINGKYWFFYGGLTDLEYALTVREDATGLTRTYSKPAGSECGGSDTAAFGP